MRKPPQYLKPGDKATPETLLWMDKIRSHHFETMGSHFLLVFTVESSFQGFLGGAGFVHPQYHPDHWSPKKAALWGL